MEDGQSGKNYIPQKQSGIKRIFSGVSLIVIILFIILFSVSFGYLFVSPIYVSNQALDTAPINTNIAVEFSKNMNKTTVESAFSLILISDYEKHVAGSFNWSTDNVVLFQPVSYLKPDSWYYVQVSDDAKDLQNNSLSSDPWEFKTSSEIKNTIDNTRYPKPDAASENLTPVIKSRTPVTLRGDLFLVTPWMVPLGYFEGYYLIIWYMIVVIIITGSLCWFLIKQGKITGKIMMFSLKNFQAPPEDTNNNFIMIIQLFLALTAFETIYMIILLSLGVNIVEPDFNLPIGNILYDLANASVYEELIVRLLLLGIPLAIIYRISGGNALKGFLGGSGKFKGAETFFIVLSALVFGVAHWLNGWGLWKILPAFLAGIILGYLFVKVGIQGAILFHFASNFISVPFLLITDQNVQNLYLIIELLMLFVGITYLVFYTKSSIIFLGEKMGYKKEEKTYEDISFPQPKGDIILKALSPSEFGYRCSSCGWLEAKYLGSGKFQCLRCGATSGYDNKTSAQKDLSGKESCGSASVNISLTLNDPNLHDNAKNDAKKDTIDNKL